MTTWDELLERRGESWNEAISRRHSRRTFDGVPVDARTLDQLDQSVAVHAHEDARVVLVRSPAEGIFRGIVGSYGKVTGSPHVLVMLARITTPFHQQHAGYSGQAAVLEACALGLDTCWIGGFFDRKRVENMIGLGPDERPVAISPLGHGQQRTSSSERMLRASARADRRKQITELAPGIDDGWPAWARAAAEAVRLAPSAVNRQPWRLTLMNERLVISRDNQQEAPKVTKALDCGIAMLHAELGARARGVRGRWHDRDDGLTVAEFVPEGIRR